MLKTQFDIPEVQTIYEEKPNYQILQQNPKSNQCVVYFSSNALYFPDDAKVFRKIVIEQDRFEWKKNILKSAGKIIFLRDVTKQWYWNGINSTINSIEKLAQFLHQETQDLEVTCVGNSAGGYASILFGILLRAQRVFAFAPQFSLKHLLLEERAKMNPSIVKLGALPANAKYLELQNLAHDNQVPIFYFFPRFSKIDVEQADCVKDNASIHSFPFASAVHGRTCFPINYLDLFSMSNENVIALQKQFGTDPICPFEFSKKVSGTRKTFLYVLHVLKKSFCKIHWLPRLDSNQRPIG